MAWQGWRAAAPHVYGSRGSYGDKHDRFHRLLPLKLLLLWLLSWGGLQGQSSWKKSTKNREKAQKNLPRASSQSFPPLLK